ncbi:MAG TPA: MarR family transcriptional regulator [Bacillales bacterium]|nr:MarR family transcriptional regulator [Bacillales bacterium]
MTPEQEKSYQVLRSFRRVNRVLYHLLRKAADDLDVTVVQIMVLHVLAEKPNIGLNELAERLQLGNSTMSGVVERLVSAGLIVRERSAEDRRSLVMRLTPEGKKKKKEAFGEGSYLVNRLSRVLEIPDKDLEHLFQTHQKIIEKLELEGDETAL